MRTTWKTPMKKVFSNIAINGLVLKNRFVRAATWEGLATPEGEVTQKLIDMLVTVAQGGVGLIISSHAYVSEEGRGTPGQLGIYSDKLIPELKRLTSAIHEHDCKIMLQLAHAGEFAETELTKQPAWSVSGSSHTENHFKVITSKDISCIVASYANAAKRAKEAGFDGIEIHSAHGYVLSQFLSSAFNRRTDSYGGDIKNRTRIHREILQAVRAVVGADFPVLIKMNCADFIKDGLEEEESLQAAKIFEESGFDAIEMSGGIIRTGKLSPSRPGIFSQGQEAYFQDFARKFKSALGIPLILVGGIKSFETVTRIVEDGIADCVSLSRCLIREPDLVNRWQRGDLRPAECKSDNLCFTPGFEGKGVYCVTREIEERKGGETPASLYS